MLRSAGFTWREVENAMLISRSTIWRETGTFMSKYCDIADSAIVRVLMLANPSISRVDPCRQPVTRRKYCPTHCGISPC